MRAGAAGTATAATAGASAAGASGNGATAGMSTGAAGTGSAVSGVTPGYKSCGVTAKEGMCKPDVPGVYAMKVDVDVYWQDENNSPTLYDPGRGKISVFLKGELTDVCEDGSGGTSVVQTCGDVIPPLLVDANCKIIQIVFPDAMWDQPGMPKIMTTGAVTGFSPQDVLTFAKAAGIYGIDLSSPTASWPTYMQTAGYTCRDGKKGKDCFPDHDGDGNPGITVTLKTEGALPATPYACLAPWEYSAAPVDVLQAVVDPLGGASETYIGLRASLGGGGKLTSDCKSGSGPSDVDAFESRLYDCKLKSGTKCSVAEAEFVDKNLPNFHILKVGEKPPAGWVHPRPDADAKLDRSPSTGPIGSVVRLGAPGANVSCEMVRKATFPAATP